MRVAIVTDIHVGARSDSKIMANHFAKFYTDVFFPTLEEQGITRVLMLGDIFDRRKYINFQSLYAARNYLFEPLRDYQVDVIVGNHDTALKSTNEINSLELLLGEYTNITPHTEPIEIEIDGTMLALLPWVCSDNYKQSMQFLQNTVSQVLFGHLEIQGFEMHIGARSDTGFDSSVFSRFSQVFSGHFHHRSTKGNITYLGSPYEMTWADYKDPRGFHLYDTDTRELTFVENPYRLFYKLTYNDSTPAMERVVNDGIFEAYEGTFVKVIVEQRTDPLLYERFISKIDASKPADVTIIDDTIHIQFTNEIAEDIEDTAAIIKSTVDTVSKEEIRDPLFHLLTRLHQDALQMSKP